MSSLPPPLRRRRRRRTALPCSPPVPPLLLLSSSSSLGGGGPRRRPPPPPPPSRLRAPLAPASPPLSSSEEDSESDVVPDSEESRSRSRSPSERRRGQVTGVSVCATSRGSHAAKQCTRARRLRGGSGGPAGTSPPSLPLNSASLSDSMSMTWSPGPMYAPPKSDPLSQSSSDCREKDRGGGGAGRVHWRAVQHNETCRATSLAVPSDCAKQGCVGKGWTSARVASPLCYATEALCHPLPPQGAPPR